MFNEIQQIFGETLTSLYISVTKSSPLSVPFQGWLRSVVFVLAGLFLGNIKDIVWTPTAIMLSLNNIVHLYSSYYAFKELPVGISNTLFYTYPFFYLFLSREFNPLSYLLILVCLIGTYLIYADGNLKFSWLPILAIFMSAFTEAITFFLVKSINTNTMNEIFITYLAPLIFLMFQIPGFIQEKQSLDNIGKITGFNLIGLLGYFFLYNAVKGLNPTVYSILSYSGVISTFIIGKYFFSETYSNQSIFGIVLILLSSMVQKIFSG